MTDAIIVADAGPLLTFLGAGYHRLLIDIFDARGVVVYIPEVVREEVHNRSRSEQFAGCADAMEALVAEHKIVVLNADYENARLAAAVQRVARMPLAERLLRSKDLGETMVVAHALVMQSDGVDVRVYIDEWRGTELARSQGLTVRQTTNILAAGATGGMINSMLEMREIYERLRRYDLGLVHWDDSGLRTRNLYRNA